MPDLLELHDMALKLSDIENPEAPLYPIGVVAELLKVTDQTLRVYVSAFVEQ